MRILLAIDTSPSSARVVEAALSRPWPADTVFGLVNVVDLTWYAELPALVADASHEAKRLVQQADETFARAGLALETHVITGSPRHAIPLFATEWNADLILVGSHGHGAIGRFLLGSVAQRVLRKAHCSVEIIRPQHAGPDKHHFKVLLATDGSECSKLAAETVASQPWPPGTMFRIVSAEELVIPGNVAAAESLSPVYPASLLEKLARDAHNRAVAAVEQARTILCSAKLPVDAACTPLGDARAVVLDNAKGWGADLIILGSHGLAGLDRLVLGSVSETVALHAHSSVRVVRSRKVRQES